MRRIFDTNRRGESLILHVKIPKNGGCQASPSSEEFSYGRTYSAHGYVPLTEVIKLHSCMVSGEVEFVSVDVDLKSTAIIDDIPDEHRDTRRWNLSIDASTGLWFDYRRHGEAEDLPF